MTTSPTQESRRLRRRRLGLGLMVVAGLLLAGLLGWLGWVEHQVRLAQQDIQARRFSKALERLTLAMQTHQHRPGLVFQAAQTARRHQDYDQAETLLDRFFQMTNKAYTPEIHLERELTRAQQGTLPQSIEKQLHLFAVTENPYTALVAEALVYPYLRTSRLQQAIACLDGWLKVEPDNTWALNRRAHAYDRLGHYDDAITDYQKVIELDPDDRKATIRLAQLLLNERRNPQEAEPLFQRVVDEQPDNAEGKTGLAQCLAARGQTQEALQQLDDVLREAPANVNALVERGKVALILQRYQAAETDLRKALQLARYDPRSYYNLVLALKGQKGREKEAEAMAAELARVNADHRQMEELIKKYTSDPNNVGLLVEVAQIYLRYDLPREAMPFLNRALDRAPYDPKVHASLAEAWAKLGNLDQARIHRQQAGLSGNPPPKK